ncbi:hypothetical protein WA026_018401 [Henosepilachna vigintioctopunctata]|uniref:Membrane insertase YidC/Oxa/ALB C-terminal domain-containing protein n=1 Tax=Henosepilachna vigintioctopunctata TaxID=420089 RepID=A0AAW1V0T4_9CUCU
MLSRTCFLSQFKDYSKSVQNTRKLLQQKNLRFSTTVVILKKQEVDEQCIALNKQSYVNRTGERLKKWMNNLSRNKIGNIAGASLILDANIDPLPSNTVSKVADQTVSQLLDSKTNSLSGREASVSNTNVPPINESPIQTETISQAVPASAESSNIVIPEPPPIPDVPFVEIAEQLNALGQPTFASLGLGGWTPAGIVQNCFEYLNVSLGIPWWEAIIIGTVFIRISMFPLVIISQRNASKMNNTLPQLQAIQMKLTEARQSGNNLEAAKYSQEMMLFMKEKGVNPLKNMVVPLAQMPIFLSFFIGLRQMANAPVESLKTGGLWWFTDLTLPDQFYLMPVITSITLWATIELGTDSAKLSSQNLQTMKYVLRALPVFILPFTINFPGAILVYWASSNFVSLAQVGFLKIPAVREYFNIEKTIAFNPESLPVKPKGFTEGLKDSWTNMKIVNQLEERRRLDDIHFRRAGKGPITKTYKYDPTKQINPTGGVPVNAKKR